MVLRFIGAEAALSYELVDERVVVREPDELVLAQAVCAAVADVRERDPILADVERGQRGAHSRLLRVAPRELVDARVRLLDAVVQVVLGIAAAVGETPAEAFDRETRGHLSRLRAAHSVGDDEEGRASEQRILVCPPLSSGVGGGVLLGYAQHQSVSKVNSLSPMRTRSPGCSGRGVSRSSSLR